MEHIEEVREIVGQVLGLGERKNSLNRDSALLGSLPELDSMAVVSLLTALEEHFGIAVDDDEISSSSFATLGSLAQFVEEKLTV